MALTTVGAQAIASLVAADGGVTAFNSANAYVGVGDDGTAFSVAQTDLIGTSTRKQVSGITGTFPSAVRTYTATFTTSEANYDWLEVGLFNAAASGQMLCRRVIALGTKPSDQSWTVELELTYSA